MSTTIGHGHAPEPATGIGADVMVQLRERQRLLAVAISNRLFDRNALLRVHTRLRDHAGAPIPKDVDHHALGILCRQEFNAEVLRVVIAYWDWLACALWRQYGNNVSLVVPLPAHNERDLDAIATRAEVNDHETVHSIVGALRRSGTFLSGIGIVDGGTIHVERNHILAEWASYYDWSAP